MLKRKKDWSYSRDLLFLYCSFHDSVWVISNQSAGCFTDRHVSYSVAQIAAELLEVYLSPSNFVATEQFTPGIYQTPSFAVTNTLPSYPRFSKPMNGSSHNALFYRWGNWSRVRLKWVAQGQAVNCGRIGNMALFSLFPLLNLSPKTVFPSPRPPCQVVVYYLYIGSTQVACSWTRTPWC